MALVAYRAIASLSIALGVAGGACASHPAPAPAARTCACAPGQACVDGRCKDTQRIVVWPVATAYVHRGSTGDDAMPPEATLGSARASEAELLLRFAIDLPPGSTIVAAHVLLDRAPLADADPEPLTLRAARIIDPWDERSIPWARAPRLEAVRTPRATVSPEQRVVRVDVTDLARRWRRRASNDRGVAIVADGTTPSGMAFALVPDVHEPDSRLATSAVTSIGPPTLFVPARPAEMAQEIAGNTVLPPRLEMYVSP